MCFWRSSEDDTNENEDDTNENENSSESRLEITSTRYCFNFLV